MRVKSAQVRTLTKYMTLGPVSNHHRRALMSHYIALLNAEVKADQDRRDREAQAERAAEVAAARERFTPLEARLGRLLATIPDEVQRDGLSLPSLQIMLKGRVGVVHMPATSAPLCVSSAGRASGRGVVAISALRHSGIRPTLQTSVFDFWLQHHLKGQPR